MKNTTRIKLFQSFPTYLRGFLTKVLSSIKPPSPEVEESILGIRQFINRDAPKARALLVFSPSAWSKALRDSPNIRFFNYEGLIFEIVKVLNSHGYEVDIVSLRAPEIPRPPYKLMIAHGGHCRGILDKIGNETVILQYVSGCFWPTFNRETDERYQDFSKRRRPRKPLAVRRSLEGLVEGEAMLTERADYLFSIGLSRMLNSFGEYGNKFFTTGLGAYPDTALSIPTNTRNFRHGRKNFIYVAGTGGNIQKGLDVLLEAFSLNLDLHLYIYCKVEKEVIEYCSDFLDSENIHYIFDLRLTRSGQRKLTSLMKNICFTVHAGINSGLGTAFSGSIGLGLIPVGYIDLKSDESWNVLSDSWQPSSLAETFRDASNKPIAWCEIASMRAVQEYNDHWTSAAFAEKFESLVNRVESEKFI